MPKFEDENTLGIIKKTEKGFKTPPVRYKRKLNWIISINKKINDDLFDIWVLF